MIHSFWPSGETTRTWKTTKADYYMLYREIENRYWSAGERKKEKKKQVRFQIGFLPWDVLTLIDGRVCLLWHCRLCCGQMWNITENLNPHREKQQQVRSFGKSRSNCYISTRLMFTSHRGRNMNSEMKATYYFSVLRQNRPKQLPKGVKTNKQPNIPFCVLYSNISASCPGVKCLK